ncbi:CmcI family methyltransferase [Sulfuriflexus mobilis]|uniref:CmcI family methyltransferase n=1 Tax=Sulfuriflexus mobilis TaxID=1811807 RepID=UPI000F836C9D|nr:CmcI family methyltransferase [Sulfuriflexus mobilis]
MLAWQAGFPDRTHRLQEGAGEQPQAAVWEYLKAQPEFEIDKQIDYKLLISVAPNGYLKRVR